MTLIRYGKKGEISVENINDRPTPILTRLVKVTPLQVQELQKRIEEAGKAVNHKEVILYPMNGGIMLMIEPEVRQ
jgi:uncharacterized protein YbaR (Trm112 family)